MPFSTGSINDPQAIGGGERLGVSNIILTALDFEDGLKVGRFAKLDAGSLDNMDGSGTPTIAGVVMRNVANPVEDGAVIDADLFEQVEFMRKGMTTVDVKAGETPAMFGAVYASNAGDADDGLAVTSAGIDVKAEFIAEIQPGVWSILFTS